VSASTILDLLPPIEQEHPFVNLCIEGLTLALPAYNQWQSIISFGVGWNQHSKQIETYGNPLVSSAIGIKSSVIATIIEQTHIPYALVFSMVQISQQDGFQIEFLDISQVHRKPIIVGTVLYNISHPNQSFCL
jgi:hypothetical protein